MKIDFARHNVEEEDIQRVAEVLRGMFLTTGAGVAHLEEALAAYAGTRRAVGVTSATAGLHLALLAWGVGEGDEVITTPLSFCATAHVALHVGATPVFVDVEASTGNLDASLVEAAVTARTRAIIPVHLYGQMCDMAALRAIADRHGLALIEDAAHCIEGRRDGYGPGQLGDAACFSFYATKNITSGEGGAVVTGDEEKADLIKKLRLHGMDRPAADRYSRKNVHYDVDTVGWKYNMDDIQAALLIGQLARIDRLWERRDELYRRYEQALGSDPRITIPATCPGRHARHLFTIQVDPARREAVLDALRAREIGVAVNFHPIHLFTFYRERYGYAGGDFPVAERIGASTITLPLYPKLTDAEADRVIEAVKESLDETGVRPGNHL